MDRQPVLEGERLRLRPLRDDDATELTAVACDPLLWAQHPVPERADEAHFRPYLALLLERAGTLVVEQKDSGELIGSSTYANFRAEGTGVVEIGSTFLARKHWGGIANRDLKLLMLRHAFRYVGLVEFLIGEENLRSRRAVEKIGGRLTDRIVMVENSGRGIKHLVYEITREQFASGPLST